jgi:hypothetical protein
MYFAWQHKTLCHISKLSLDLGLAEFFRSLLSLAYAGRAPVGTDRKNA